MRNASMQSGRRYSVSTLWRLVAKRPDTERLDAEPLDAEHLGARNLDARSCERLDAECRDMHGAWTQSALDAGRLGQCRAPRSSLWLKK